MGLAKRLGKSETIRGFLCWLAGQYIRLIWLTGRWRVENGHIPAGYWDRGEPFILSFWHGRLLMMMKSWRRGLPVYMLTSEHRDGQLIARTAAPFGIGTITGSSTRGGAGGLRALLKMLKSGGYVGITPDGPKGPRMRATDGIITLAKLSGVPIIPLTYSASPRWLLKSWDRFLVPGLFGQGVFIWGEPIHIARDADADQLEQGRLHLENTLNGLTDEADGRVGEPMVPPA